MLKIFKRLFLLSLLLFGVFSTTTFAEYQPMDGVGETGFIDSIPLVIKDKAGNFIDIMTYEKVDVKSGRWVRYAGEEYTWEDVKDNPTLLTRSEMIGKKNIRYMKPDNSFDTTKKFNIKDHEHTDGKITIMLGKNESSVQDFTVALKNKTNGKIYKVNVDNVPTKKVLSFGSYEVLGVISGLNNEEFVPYTSFNVFSVSRDISSSNLVVDIVKKQKKIVDNNGQKTEFVKDVKSDGEMIQQSSSDTKEVKQENDEDFKKRIDETNKQKKKEPKPFNNKVYIAISAIAVVGFMAYNAKRKKRLTK